MVEESDYELASAIEFQNLSNKILNTVDFINCGHWLMKATA